jgi:hypothetical protein
VRNGKLTSTLFWSFGFKTSVVAVNGVSNAYFMSKTSAHVTKYIVDVYKGNGVGA